MSRPTFDQMDIRKIGFVSKDEYMKLNSWKAGKEQALAAFKLMDTDNDGQVTGIFITYYMVAMVSSDIRMCSCMYKMPLINMLSGQAQQPCVTSPVQLFYSTA